MLLPRIQWSTAEGAISTVQYTRTQTQPNFVCVCFFVWSERVWRWRCRTINITAVDTTVSKCYIQITVAECVWKCRNRIVVAATPIINMVYILIYKFVFTGTMSQFLMKLGWQRIHRIVESVTVHCTKYTSIFTLTHTDTDTETVTRG